MAPEDDVLDAQPDADVADVEAQAQQTQDAEQQALQSGDYSTAHDLATQADFDLNNTAGVDPSLVNAADAESSATDWAQWNQATADDNAQWAANYEAAGDSDHAAEYGAIADDHAATADGYAGTADGDLATGGTDTTDTGG